MRSVVAVAAAFLVLVPCVSAGPGLGTDLTASSDTWWIHADEEYGPWMSNVRQEGTDPYAGWGPNQPTVSPPGLGFATTTFPLEPAPRAAISLDTADKIAVDVWVGGGMAGQVFLTPLLVVDGQTLALGEELSGNFLDGGLVHFGWDLTPRLATIPAGAEVELQFRLSGAYDAAFYWMEGDQWTAVELPVLGGAAPAAPTPVAGTTGPAPSASASSTSATTSTPTTSASRTASAASTPTAAAAAPVDGHGPAPTAAPDAEGGDGDAKDASAPAGPSILVGLAAAAAILAVRRRL